MAKHEPNGDPWRMLETPIGENPITGSRVDAEHPWNFFWALDSSGQPSLAFGHSSGVSKLRLPRARGLRMTLEQSSEPKDDLLLLTLTDPSLRDVFARLCLDIVSRTRQCTTEVETYSVMVKRTWRWHHLLAGGGNDRLSAKRQLGLLGELTVLDQLMLPNVPARAAVEGWVGPERGPKDFELGHVSVEAKAHKPGRIGEIRISSLDQLRRSASSDLFLCVTAISPSGSNPGVTVTSESGRVRERLADLDPAMVDLYDMKLAAAGLSDDHDYDDSQWTIGEVSVFEVSAEFPRIDPSNVAPTVKSACYTLELSECSPFLTDLDRLAGLLRSGSAHE